MYQRFAKEHGIEPFTPPPFSMLKYQKEVERLERAYNVHFNTLWNMVSKAKFTLMKRFFETIAIRVKHVFDIANRDLESWLKAVMAPLETQVREHHLQLRRRLESVKRIHRASDELEERIAELEQAEVAARAQIGALARELAAIDAISSSPNRCRSRPTASGFATRPIKPGRCRPWPPSGPGTSAAADPCVSTKSGFTGMQSTGQTSTHCGVSKWPTHSVHLPGSIT